MTTTENPATDFETQVGAYAERLFTTGLAAFEAYTIALGRQLGLYDALAAQGPSTAPELAAAAGIDARYAREWLEQQATAGLLDVEGATDADPDERRFSLSASAQECLIRPDSLASMGPLFDFVTSLGSVMPALQDAFRTGAGVPYADYAVHDVQGDFNRPLFLNVLASEWLPSIPGLAERLSAPGASVAEIGCGEGWAAIGIAQAWPGVRVDGYDLDEASIAAARKHAADAGVADRVRFEVADVADTDSFDRAAHDLVFAFEMVHDLARPVQALGTMRRLGSADATYLVVDENAAEAFEPSTENPVERFLYAASVLHCLPAGTTEPDSAATGTVMRPDTMRRYASAAGFADVGVLPIEHDLFRVYRLTV